jgi:hypothetical protein
VEDQDSYRDNDMKEFAEQLALLLKTPGGTSSKTDGQAPVLQVCVGEAQLEALQMMRRELPDATLLLWLVVPCAAEAFEAFQQAVGQQEGRTLVSRLDDAGLYDAKVQLAVSMLADRNVRLVAAPNLMNSFRAQIEGLDKCIKTAIENMNQEMGRGLIRLRSSLANLPSILTQGGNRLGRLDSHTNVIVCGAGPSLVEHLGLLKEVNKRVVLIAVGHAAPTLLAAGIEPDLIVSDDARIWWDIPTSRMPCPLAACTEVSPELRRLFSEVIWFQGSSAPFNHFLECLGLQLNQAELHKTVSIHAMDIARKLGCARMALVGQDLSLSATGDSHADGGRLCNGDQLFAVPGLQDETVYATNDLLALREAIQEYCRKISKQDAHGPEIYNCTHRGARIGGIEHMTLEAFCAPLLQNVKKHGLIRREKAAYDPAVPATMLNELRAYRTASQAVVDACRKLSRELGQYPIKEKRLRAAQKELNDCLPREEAARNAPTSAPWLNALSDYAEQVIKETPRLCMQQDGMEDALKLIDERYRFSNELCDDLCADMQQVCDVMTQDEAPETTTDAPFHPCVFNAFRASALRVIQRENRDLADALRDRRRWDMGGRFAIRLVNQALQYVEVVSPTDGNRVALSALFSMYEKAASEVDHYIQETAFDPERHALVLPIPGNWVHVVSWVERFPGLELMVVEPWLALLSHLIDCGCFLHKLPGNTLILGVDETLKKGDKPLQAKLKVWHNKGLEARLFIPPPAKNLPEAEVLTQQVSTWLRS